MAFSTARHRALSTLLSYSNYLTTPSSALCAFTSSSYRATRFALPLLDRIDRTLFDTSTRSYAVGRGGGGHSPLKDPSPNWTNRPPKETILLDGCDYEHWLIVMEFPEDPKLSQDEMIDAYVKTLAQVVGSEEEAKKKIYSVSTTTYTGFGALISEELSLKMKELPQVLWVLPDSYLDVPNKDYGGDLFVDGKVIRRPQYDFSNRQPTKTRPRPRYDRRRQSMQVERRPMNSSMGQAQHDQRPTSGEGQNSS